MCDDSISAQQKIYFLKIKKSKRERLDFLQFRMLRIMGKLDRVSMVTRSRRRVRLNFYNQEAVLFELS